MKTTIAASLLVLFAAPAFAADASIAVPAGHTVAMTALGAGDLTYECRAKANMADAYEWAFVGPTAVLYDKNRSAVGKYYAGPTWEANDGSKVTGKQLAVSPSTTPGSIPLQLVQANPAMGSGAMTGITYIQRMNTRGGVAPADLCGAANAGAKKTVPYEADYVFYKAV
ncbi:MAG TPA: DUF3455 domain-containing protein [Burkholderiaceae bacterium]